MRPLRFAPALLAGLFALTGCGGTETPPEEAHTPASAAVEVNGDVHTDILLEAGATVPVEVKFYADDGDEITGIDDEHFAKLTFTPSTLATVADVADEHFHKTVTAQAAPGSGVYTIGYGHDADADELSFGPYDVTVVATGIVKK